MKLTGLNGTTYTLDPTPISSGGEGDIYSVRGMDYVAKIYRTGELTMELYEKLMVMIEHPPNASVLSQVALPLEIVHEDGGPYIGFVMPKLSINAELGEIYKYPPNLRISAHQKINIAQNICVVISEVHKAGYVFGDFNPRNIGLDIDTGLVSFLDTDTYHVTDTSKNEIYRCNVCAPGYAAPELLEKCSDYVAENPEASKEAYAQTPLPTFTRETDNFALAIHMFKLLMNGYTPFGGIIETASVSQSSPGVGDAAVRRDSYCFKPGYKHQSAAILPLEALPQEIADLFTQAFIVGRHASNLRPGAAQWHEALKKYEQTLVTCPDNLMHQYDRKNNACPLCEADSRYAAMIGGSALEAASLMQSPYAPLPEIAQRNTVQPHVHAAKHRTAAATAPMPKTAQGQAAQSSTHPMPASNPLQTAKAPKSTSTTMPVSVNIGDIIKFGSFDWRVLEVESACALIITENIIEQRRYHHARNYKRARITWAFSEMRDYLNNEYIYGFSAVDRARIRVISVDNKNNQWFGTDGGKDTIDSVFLLSLEEVVRYFGDSRQLRNRPARSTFKIKDQFNSARVAKNAIGTALWWWLRSPGDYSSRVACVGSSGSIDVVGLCDVNWSDGGVRPALWLNL